MATLTIDFVESLSKPPLNFNCYVWTGHSFPMFPDHGHIAHLWVNILPPVIPSYALWFVITKYCWSTVQAIYIGPYSTESCLHSATWVVLKEKCWRHTVWQRVNGSIANLCCCIVIAFEADDEDYWLTWFSWVCCQFKRCYANHYSTLGLI